MTAHPATPEEMQQEIARLRERVSELEQQVARYQPAHDMLQLIVDSLPGAVFWKDRESIYQGCNHLFAAHAGVGDPANIVGKSDYDLSWKTEEADFFREVDQRVMAAGIPEYHIIEPQQQADGKQVWLDTNKIPLCNAAGEVIGILGTYEDITERREVEQALRDSEERFRTLVETIAVAAWIHKEGRFVYVNPATESLLGYDGQELLTMRVWQVIHQDFLDVVQQRASARQRGEDPQQRYEIQVLTKQGEARWVDLSANRIEFEGNTCILVTFLDVTERKQIEQSLRLSEARFRALTETIPVALMIHQEGGFLYVNPAGEQITGYAQEDLPDLTFQKLIHPDFLETVQQRARARQRGEHVPAHYQIKIVRKDGAIRWVELDNSLIEIDGKPATLVTALDTTERQRMEENLRRSEARFRTVIETSNVAMWIHRAGHMVFVNTATEELLGYSSEELYTMHVADVVHPDFREMVRKRAETRMQDTQEPARYEVLVVTKQGAERWIDLRTSVIEFEGQPAVLVTGLDITERKQSEEARIQTHIAVIEAQESALRELSTPLIPISDAIVVMPLVGRIDQTRAQLVMEELLNGITRYRARVAILDITGVPTVDEQVAVSLVQAAQAVQLLGAQVVLTGIRPDVAQRLVGLDMTLGSIVTYSNLQAGIAHATGRHGQ